ncbi:MAG: hypothetical protein S4CHLAM20_04350 [Chlamydiia bacterium]|nr:hypothetical protein [Chlamydiia bacterium]
MEYNEFLPEKTVHQEDENLKWLKERMGMFTGSKIHDIMSCNRLTSKKSWGEPSKLFGVGSGFYKYVFQVAMERKTGCMNNETKSFNLDYGKENELPLINHLKSAGIIESYSECDFMRFKELNLGATPDGRITLKGEVMALEMKSSVSWDGCYTRKKSKVDEKHCDFWQIQTEMLVLGVKKCLYVVTYPMTYENYAIEIVGASELHQKRLLQRYELAEKCISNWDFEEDIEVSIEKTLKEEYASLSV